MSLHVGDMTATPSCPYFTGGKSKQLPYLGVAKPLVYEKTGINASWGNEMGFFSL